MDVRDSSVDYRYRAGCERVLDGGPQPALSSGKIEKNKPIFKWHTMGFTMRAAGMMARGGSKKRKRRAAAAEAAMCAKPENREVAACVARRQQQERIAAYYAQQLKLIEYCRQEPYEWKCIGTSTESACIITLIAGLIIFLLFRR